MRPLRKISLSRFLPEVFQLCCCCCCCFPSLLTPVPFPAGPGSGGGCFPSLWACMLRSSCAGDLPATLLFLLSTASVLLKWCILCLQSFIIFFFVFGSRYYLFVRATDCSCWCGHTHLYVDLVFLWHTHTHAVVMPEDGDLKQTEDWAGLISVLFIFFFSLVQWVTRTVFSFV